LTLPTMSRVVREPVMRASPLSVPASWRLLSSRAPSSVRLTPAIPTSIDPVTASVNAQAALGRSAADRCWRS
jgi:hypothetical protein